MPNWVHNRVTVTGPAGCLDALVERVRGLDGSAFSFQSILPRPAESDESWYEWNCANWSTKWDACQPVLDRVSSQVAVFEFDTAWAPPEGVMCAFALAFPEVAIEHWFEEEQGWGGVVKLSGSSVTCEQSWDVPSSHSELVQRNGECWCAGTDEPMFADCLVERAAEAGLGPEQLRTASALAAEWGEGVDALLDTARVL